MFSELRAWLPGLTFYFLGAIAPALFIVLSSH
jgi:hypothetical protein